MLGEGLGAVAGLEEEGLAVCHLAQLAVRSRASPANTSGGSVASVASAFLSASASGQSGCWDAGNFRQDAALQEEAEGGLVTAPG